MDKPIKRVFSDEHRKKLSIARMGKTPWNKGLPMSEKTRAKMVGRKTNVPAWNAGKSMSVIARVRMSAAKLGKPGPWLGKKRPNMTGENHPRWRGGYDNKLHENRRRKAQKKANGGGHSLSEWNQLKERSGYMCQKCLKIEPDIKLTADHIIPISKGGSDDITNIQALCAPCNASKGNRVIRRYENGAWVDLI